MERPLGPFKCAAGAASAGRGNFSKDPVEPAPSAALREGGRSREMIAGRCGAGAGPRKGWGCWWPHPLRGRLPPSTLFVGKNFSVWSIQEAQPWWPDHGSPKMSSFSALTTSSTKTINGSLVDVALYAAEVTAARGAPRAQT